MKIVALAALLAASAAADDEPPIVVPLEGLTAACCEKPVQEAFAAIDGVAKVELDKADGKYRAWITLKQGRTLSLAALTKSLEGPNKGMGAQMGTTYKIAASIDVAWVHFMKTKAKPDADALKAALGKLGGFSSVRVADGGFFPAFTGDALPTIDDVKKASGLEVEDVLLAAASNGVRFFCPMHPDVASAKEGTCPKCGEMKLEKIAASKGPAPKAAEPKKKGG